MKEIDVTWISKYRPKNALIYPSPNPSFSWFGAKVDGKFQQIAGWHGCRETFASDVRRYFTGLAGGWHYAGKMDGKQTRIAVGRKHPNNITPKQSANAVLNNAKWMKESVRMLNILEKKLGWGLTRVYKCSDKCVDMPGAYIYLFIGSPKWMRAPQLLSLYLLIIRLGRLHTRTKIFERFEDLEKLGEAFGKCKLSGQAGSDMSWFVNTSTWWGLMLDNVQELFFETSLTDNYIGNTGQNGIQEFVRGNMSASFKKKWANIKRRKTNEGKVENAKAATA